MAHHYPFALAWTGNTLDGAYNRNATVTHPGKPALSVSSAPEYAGDATRWNPEDLLGAALSTCHMLTFLALCSKARVEIRGYEDHAEAILDTVDKVARVTQVYLRPVISVGHGTHQDKVLELFEKAHKYCFVANSVTCEAILQPQVVEV
jgi:organic hydroperoxide reductase OsmC/OhrA